MTLTQASVVCFMVKHKWIFSVRFRSNPIGNNKEFSYLRKCLKTGSKKRPKLL